MTHVHVLSAKVRRNEQRWQNIDIGNIHLDLGEFTPSYILHTRAIGTYLLRGGGYLPCKKNYKVMVLYM
jgi:hypothetical protein